MKSVSKTFAMLGVVWFAVLAFAILASAPAVADDKAPSPTPDAGVIER